jgi:hypothetical protein
MGEVFQPRLPAFAPLEPIDALAPLTLDQKFDRFHAANPWLYRELVRLARTAVRNQHARGRTDVRIGIKALVERFRWEYDTLGRGDGDYKFNNNYASRYARLIAATEPDLQHVFEFRELTSQREGE